MPQSDMTPLLADDYVAEALKNPNKTIGRDIPRNSHAASTGINSSFT